MKGSHIWAVARKELNHILRDRTAFFLVAFTPTLLLLLMAYALTVNIRHVPIAVLDYDRSALSRAFVQRLVAGDDLDLWMQATSMEEIETALNEGKIKAALILSPEFSRDLLAVRGMPMQIVIDGTEPESGYFAVDHIVSRAEAFADSVLANQMQAMGISQELLSPLDVRVRAWYNPGLKSRNDIIPGLISMVLRLPALSVALALAHEREHGTLEQLLATPIGKWAILLGKMLPYLFAGMLNAALLPLLAEAWFDVPFNGSFLLFLALSAVFLFSILGMGIVIGVFMKTQAAALALSFLMIFYPGFFLTGIFFPVVSMPEAMRMEAMEMPGTHFAIIAREIFLPGVGLEALWSYTVMLILLGVAFYGIAALFFSKKLG